MRLDGIRGTVIVALLLLQGVLVSQTKPWELIGPEGGPLTALAQSPSNPSILLAASPPPPGYSADATGDLFKSTDHGATWSRCSETDVMRGSFSSGNAMLFDPTDPLVVYALGPNFLYRSLDGGQTWIKLDLPAGHYINEFKLSRSDHTMLHAVGTAWDATKGVSYPLYLHKSAPESTWTAQVLSPLEGFVDLCIEVESSTPQNIYISGFSLSTQRGSFWRSTNGGLDFSVRSLATLDPICIIAADPSNPARLFAATYSGILLSTDSGDSWTKNNGTLPRPTSLCVVGGYVYVATFEGVYRSTDGLNYTLIPGSEYGRGEPVSMASFAIRPRVCVEPSTPHTIFLANRAGILKSTDAGQTWSTSNRGLTCGSIKALCCVPSAPTRLFVAKDLDAVYKTSVASSISVTWERLRDFYSCTGVSEIAVSPIDPTVVYALDGGG